VHIAGASPGVRAVLLHHGVRPPHVQYDGTVADAIAAARKAIG
jgi:SulP family sulfate permease